MSAVSLITASVILIAGVIDDLRSRKVHNWLFLACTALAFVVVFATGGAYAIAGAALGFVAGLGILLPLVLLKVIGAGDMKLMAAFGAVVGWSATLDVALISLIWGAIFGLAQVAMKGQVLATLRNMTAIVKLEDRKALVLHKIPFTFALLMGWLTHLVSKGVA